MGLVPSLSFCLANSAVSLISFTPELTADISTKAALWKFATRRANVVYPHPGGPQRIKENNLFAINNL